MVVSANEVADEDVGMERAVELVVVVVVVVASAAAAPEEDDASPALFGCSELVSAKGDCCECSAIDRGGTAERFAPERDGVTEAREEEEVRRRDKRDGEVDVPRRVGEAGGAEAAEVVEAGSC